MEKKNSDWLFAFLLVNHEERNIIYEIKQTISTVPVQYANKAFDTFLKLNLNLLIIFKQSAGLMALTINNQNLWL